MYLSDGDLQAALNTGQLIVDPRPTSIDPTSIDLHLGSVAEAKVWDTARLTEHLGKTGATRPEVRIAKYNYSVFSKEFLKAPPAYDDNSEELVQLRGNQVVVRNGGFVLWQTRERVGTPENAEFICFVDGKSTKARAGILVHLTAPTIHSTWVGNITLEIVNLGPFDLVLQENDVIAQLTVAKITCPPLRNMLATSTTYGQSNVGGTATPSTKN